MPLHDRVSSQGTLHHGPDSQRRQLFRRLLRTPIKGHNVIGSSSVVARIATAAARMHSKPWVLQGLFYRDAPQRVAFQQRMHQGSTLYRHAGVGQVLAVQRLVQDSRHDLEDKV